MQRHQCTPVCFATVAQILPERLNFIEIKVNFTKEQCKLSDTPSGPVNSIFTMIWSFKQVFMDK